MTVWLVLPFTSQSRNFLRPGQFGSSGSGVESGTIEREKKLSTSCPTVSGVVRATINQMASKQWSGSVFFSLYFSFHSFDAPISLDYWPERAKGPNRFTLGRFWMGANRHEWTIPIRLGKVRGRARVVMVQIWQKLISRKVQLIWLLNDLAHQPDKTLDWWCCLFFVSA